MRSLSLSQGHGDVEVVQLPPCSQHDLSSLLALTALSHPALVKVLDVVPSRANTFLVQVRRMSASCVFLLDIACVYDTKVLQ